MKSHWITHKGHQVWLADYSGFGSDIEALHVEVDASGDLTCQQPEDSMLVLVDVRGTVGSSEMVSCMKQSAKRTGVYHRRAAAVGISGIRALLLQAVNLISEQQFKGFSDDEMEKALDWLVKG